MNKITTNKIVVILREKYYYFIFLCIFLNFHKDLTKVESDEKLCVSTRNSLVFIQLYLTNAIHLC
jgi:hypothetical protein